jgi:lysophospholipase L1-like esterase
MPCCTNERGMTRKRNANLVLLGLLFLCSSVLAQDTLDFTTGKDSGFIPSGENSIHNSASLSTFFEKLYQLKKGLIPHVSVIHLGDSHIQADFLSGVVRQNFQRDFGNAGRGFIIPGHVAHTNEPFSIVTSSAAAWEVKRMVTPDLPLPIGVGGITLKTRQPEARLSIKTLNSPPLDYGFRTLTLFFQKNFASFNLVIKDSVGRDLAFLGPYTFEPYANTSSVILPFKTNFITLQALPPTPPQAQLVLFGIDLENGKPGVAYHAIGVNGAKYKHYRLAALFAEQTAALHPDLFILSLGTNEALDYPFRDPEFERDIDRVVDSLQVRNPQAVFLLTTPPDSYRRKTRRNPGVEVVRQRLVDYAEKHRLAYWDLYEAGGGKHSADLWRKNRLLRADGIHFSAAGYALQANMLYEALIKGYNEFVRYRHP